jgi:hypothetical protein
MNIWKGVEINDFDQYIAVLIEGPDGHRYAEAAVADFVDGAADYGPGVVFKTAVIPRDLLGRADIMDISELVPLSTGAPFYVDAHCIWFTQEEVEDIHQGRPVRWAKGQEPKLPPK